jgi:hypothetical protein
MDNIFISSDENSSSDNINTNNSITESNRSSTSYIDSANESYISEAYSNMKGGGTAAPILKQDTPIDIKQVTKGVSRTVDNFAKSSAVKEAVKVSENLLEAISQGITQSADDLKNTNTLVNSPIDLQLLKALSLEKSQEIVNYIFQEEKEKGYKNAKNLPFYGELFKYIICELNLKDGIKGITPEEIKKWCNQENVGEKLGNIVNPATSSQNSKKLEVNKAAGTVQRGGDIDSSKYKIYYEKYLKYKLKYLELKYE